jgi:hypothetical protein
VGRIMIYFGVAVVVVVVVVVVVMVEIVILVTTVPSSWWRLHRHGTSFGRMKGVNMGILHLYAPYTTSLKCAYTVNALLEKKYGNVERASVKPAYVVTLLECLVVLAF